MDQAVELAPLQGHALAEPPARGGEQIVAGALEAAVDGHEMHAVQLAELFGAQPVEVVLAQEQAVGGGQRLEGFGGGAAEGLGARAAEQRELGVVVGRGPAEPGLVVGDLDPPALGQVQRRAHHDGAEPGLER
ncbi:MAG TPA: hypothetical protein VFS00_13230, partial [Polyangiaceae bacterium]|nr:hypothetical protein [Polyangiaceae bacterium]